MLLTPHEAFAHESTFSRFNIFDAVGIANAEIRHSNFLAWLLDPIESHGQGSLFLKAVLADLLRETPSLVPLIGDGALDDARVAREQDGCDVVISSRKLRLVVVLENKIGSKEGSRQGRSQLLRYEDAVALRFAGFEKVLAYLTLDGSKPSRPQWIPYSYGRLRGVLSQILVQAQNHLPADVATLISHYVEIIARVPPLPDKSDNHLVRTIESHVRLSSDWHVFAPYETSGYQRFHFVPSSWESLLPELGTERHFEKHWLYGWCGIRRWDFARPRLSVEFLCANTRDRLLRQRVLDAIVGASGGCFSQSSNGAWISLYCRDVNNWEMRYANDEASVVREVIGLIEDLGRSLKDLPTIIRANLAEVTSDSEAGQ